MLYMLGPVLFSVAPINAVSLSREGEYPFVDHQVLGSAPLYERMGEGARRRKIKGVTFPLVPEFASGPNSLELLEQARRSGDPLHLIRGDYSPLGWFLVEKVAEEHTDLWAHGVAQEIQFEIEMIQSDAPSTTSILSIFGAFQ